MEISRHPPPHEKGKAAYWALAGAGVGWLPALGRDPETELGEGGYPEEERGLLSEPDGGWGLGEAGRGRPTWLIRGAGLGFSGWS